jgi:hypothetical protein
MKQINVSYPYRGLFDLDEMVQDVVGTNKCGSGVGSWPFTFSGAQEGVWRDLDFEVGDELDLDMLKARLADARPDVDWQVTLMPEVE